MSNQEQPAKDQQTLPDGEPILELKDRIYLVPIKRRTLIIILAVLTVWATGLWGYRAYQIVGRIGSPATAKTTKQATLPTKPSEPNRNESTSQLSSQNIPTQTAIQVGSGQIAVAVSTTPSSSPTDTNSFIISSNSYEADKNESIITVSNKNIPTKSPTASIGKLAALSSSKIARRSDCNFDLGAGYKGHLLGESFIDFTKEFSNGMVSYCYKDENCKAVYLNDILCAFKNLYGVEIYGVNGYGADGEKYIYNNRTPEENCGYVEVFSGLLFLLHIRYYDFINGEIDLIKSINLAPGKRVEGIHVSVNSFLDTVNGI